MFPLQDQMPHVLVAFVPPAPRISLVQNMEAFNTHTWGENVKCLGILKLQLEKQQQQQQQNCQEIKSQEN